jgi:hypothetical protein
MERNPKLSATNCECMTCGEVFKSEAGFNKHRVGKYKPYDRRCLTVPEMTAIGMVRNDKHLWVTAAYDENAYTKEIA